MQLFTSFTNSCLDFSLPFIIVLIFFSILPFLQWWKHHRDKDKCLPPGSMGWPYFGETLKLYTQNPNSFFSTRQKRYTKKYTCSRQYNTNICHLKSTCLLFKGPKNRTQQIVIYMVLSCGCSYTKYGRCGRNCSSDCEEFKTFYIMAQYVIYLKLIFNV